MRGAVTVAADKFLAPLLGAVGVPDAERRACWAGQRQTLESLVSVTSAGVVDENGFGVVAKQPLRADQIIIDPTVLLVPRPSDYARAHLPPAHAVYAVVQGGSQARAPSQTFSNLLTRHLKPSPTISPAFSNLLKPARRRARTCSNAT